MFSQAFWQDAFTRMFRSFAQTLAAALGGSALNVWSAGWHQALGLAAGSAFLAFLMAVDRSTVPVSGIPVPVSDPVSLVPSPRVTTCGDSLK